MPVKTLVIIGMAITCGLAQVKIEEIGRFGGTGSTAGVFKNPSAIDITQDGRIIICDSDNHRLQIFNSRGEFLKDTGGFGWANDQFDEPRDIWARSALSIFVADYYNRRVQRFDKDLNFINSLVSNTGDDERFQFREVLSIAFSPRGDLFILDQGEKKVIKFNSQNKAEVSFAYYLSGAGELLGPVQIDLTTDHRVLISDAAGKGVFIYDYYGNFSRKIEHPQFKFPSGLAVDDQNRIYVCDPVGATIYIFTSKGNPIHQIASIGGISMAYPVDLALAGHANHYQMYVIDKDHIIIASLNYDAPQE